MTVERTDILIVGAGLAGARCAEALRAGGYDGRILVVGDEPHPPYERPALSKELLAGSRAATELALREPGFWAANRIELRLGDALPSLQALPAEETFDLAFVDADKTGYAAYVEELHARMRTNGLVLLDNTLRAGRVLDPQTDDDRAIVALNAALAADPRWETVLLPVADGLTALRKR